MHPILPTASGKSWFRLAALASLMLSSALPAGIAIAQTPQDAPKNAPQSVDDALLDDLDNELLEGAGDLKKPDKAKPTANPADERPPIDAAIDGEDVGMPSPEEDPLGFISQEMRQVEQLISEQPKRAHAEELQRRIVEDLAQLIEQAEKQQQQQQSSSSQSQSQQQTAKRQSPKQSQQQGKASAGKNSSQPASDSTDRLGQAEQVRPDPELLRGLMKDAWGHLPERDREQMQQMAPERFLPQYELLIERYYRRLAEERSQ
jgi:hypothetical protein